MIRAMVVVGILTLVRPAQAGAQDEKVLLRWKVPPGKAMGFKTNLQNIGKADDSILKVDTAALLELARAGAPSAELPPEMAGKLKEFFGGFKMPAEYSMTTLLKSQPRGRIAVLIVAEKPPDISTPSAEMTEVLKRMATGVQLRGEVTDAGKVESFWLQTAQKNLLALLVELPKDAVKPGDAWSLDVSLVQMGHGFVAEKAERVNRVRLAEVRKEADGEPVAVLEYTLAESVQGTFVMGDKTQPAALSMNFVGRGEFSVTKGRWKTLVASMKTKGSGIMTANAEQQIVIESMAAVPEELLKLR